MPLKLRPAPFNYAAMSVVIFTPSVLLFAFDGTQTRLLRWLQRVFSIATLIGAWIFFSTISVVHDNWSCYKSEDIHDVIYGRCSVRSARIRRLPSLQAPSKPFSYWHNWTDSMMVFIYVFVGIIAMNLIITATRMVLIRLDLAILTLPRKEYFEKESKARILLEKAHEAAKEDVFFVPRPDQSLVHAADRYRRILEFDLASFILEYPAIVSGMRGWHVALQPFLCLTFAASLYANLTFEGTAVWWLTTVLFSFSIGAAFLHHAYCTMHMLHLIDSSLPEANAELESHANEEHRTTHFHHVHSIVTNSVMSSVY